MHDEIYVVSHTTGLDFIGNELFFCVEKLSMIFQCFFKKNGSVI